MVYVVSTVLLHLWEKYNLSDMCFITQIVFLVYTKDKTLTAESQRLHIPSYSSICDSQPFEKTMSFVIGSCKHWAREILTHALFRLAVNFDSK